jgi:hypothetical protein
MIIEPAFKLELKAVVVKTVVFNNGIRSLESTPTVLPVPHNKPLNICILVYKTSQLQMQLCASLGLAPFGTQRHKTFLYKQVILSSQRNDIRGKALRN